MNQYRTINKWQMIKPNLKVGDVVLLTDNLVPPATWPLARVTKLHEGKDGLVRVASVSTSRGEYLRAITKLIKLPTTIEIQGNAEEPSNEE
ncbi:hypothetical protein TKK_0013774 [Trichogramma kaykai]|uniref:DUF5641 domain-containing protein n=1 Tax=Trichogramma kaykai TaxID=54128 RepID=A0ABD2WH17_9HYME